MKTNHQERAARAQTGKPKQRGRSPMDRPPSPMLEALMRRLEEARANNNPMEKVEEISRIAQELHNLGQVPASYNTFAEAMRLANSLPTHQRQEALSYPLVSFQKTGMDIEGYFGLLRTCGTAPQEDAHAD